MQELKRKTKMKKCVLCKGEGVKHLSNGDSYCEKHYEEDGIYVHAKINKLRKAASEHCS